MSTALKDRLTEAVEEIVEHRIDVQKRKRWLAELDSLPKCESKQAKLKREWDEAIAARDAHEYAQLVRRVAAAEVAYWHESLTPTMTHGSLLTGLLIGDAKRDLRVMAMYDAARRAIETAIQDERSKSPADAAGWDRLNARIAALQNSLSMVGGALSEPDPIAAIRKAMRATGLHFDEPGDD